MLIPNKYLETPNYKVKGLNMMIFSGRKRSGYQLLKIFKDNKEQRLSENAGKPKKAVIDTFIPTTPASSKKKVKGLGFIDV